MKGFEPPPYRLASALFLRLLAACFLVAFVSLWVQVHGLVGSEGILPVGPFLEGAREALGGERYRLLPALCWLDASDGAKPGDVRRRPRFVAPHQPRLDWQMWFAALSTCDQNPWLQLFLGRLLQGSPPVVRLLRFNPFPDRPPRFVRARLYDYRFTDFTTRRLTRAWWRREAKGLYCPVFSREMLRAP